MRANESTSSKRGSSAITRRPPTCGPTTRRFTATWECEAAMQWLHAVPWDLLLIQTINGIVTGMILALVASGLTLPFGIMDVVNVVHGEFVMLGAHIEVFTIVARHKFSLVMIICSPGRWMVGGR